MKENPNYIIPSVTRAIAVLQLLAERGRASFTEICKETSMPRSTAYSVINTLLQGGLVRESSMGGYKLGLKLFSLGSRALNELDIRIEAKPLIHDLVNKVNQTCHLGILDEGEAVYLDKVECARNLIVRSWVGKRLSLQSTAMGKAILAWTDEQRARRLLEHNPPLRHTDRCLTDIAAYMQHLGMVRAHGFAYDNRESNEDVFCIAAPVFSGQARHPIGAVSVSIPWLSMTADLFALISKQTHSTCAELSHRLGSRRYPAFSSMPYPGDNS